LSGVVLQHLEGAGAASDFSTMRGDELTFTTTEHSELASSSSSSSSSTVTSSTSLPTQAAAAAADEEGVITSVLLPSLVPVADDFGFCSKFHNTCKEGKDIHQMSRKMHVCKRVRQNGERV
jgi:hypothetical protein